MPIPSARAKELVTELTSGRIANLFSQVQARHILDQVGESPRNYPRFDSALTPKTTTAAYGLIEAGCSLIESGDISEGRAALERAGTILYNAHARGSQLPPESIFHILIAAMALYAAGHYSRAFILVRGVEQHSAAARVIAAFLRKDLATLVKRLNEVLLASPPEFNEQVDVEHWAVTVAIARSVAYAIEFAIGGRGSATAQGLGGDSPNIDQADRQLRDALVVALDGSHPAWWTIVRLLRLMFDDLAKASPWTALPPYFGPEANQTLRRYIQLLTFSDRAILELWASQQAALRLALSTDQGGVINLPTSGGKTRVAELAILKTLLAHPTGKVLYLAPFRSLALEVERTLGSTLAWLGYTVSHLYGGSRVSRIDAELAEEAAVVIATPEKARALFRAASELLADTKLIVIDEGHLIGPSERLVRNELFIDYLRTLSQRTGARLLLLSAVLPNPQELAQWLVGDSSTVAQSGWRPSGERRGFLRWNGSRVRIDWRGDSPSFNPSFVEARPLGFTLRRRPFPDSKLEAIAATAVRLSQTGPVMIFTGKAVSVPTLAKAALLALGREPADHPWPDRQWGLFEALCQEELADGDLTFVAARAGVICHSNRLPPQVRLALEDLMRSYPPRLIIATTTLAQGVNVGVSTVIVASVQLGLNEYLTRRDFRNIAGRAGRAYVDTEGKVLYVIDETVAAWKRRNDVARAEAYFTGEAGDRVRSGLLFVTGQLRTLATLAQIPFARFVEMAASNRFSAMGKQRELCESLCDLLDTELLALTTIQPTAAGVDAVGMIEDVFRSSLAAIQARLDSNPRTLEETLAIIKARAEHAITETEDSNRRSAVLASGLPLSSALRAAESPSEFARIADLLGIDEPNPSGLPRAAKALEAWARENAPSLGRVPEKETLNRIRSGWLSGKPLTELSRLSPDAGKVCRDFYGYLLPWIANAASQVHAVAGDEDRARALARVGLLVELGLSSETAARIFLAGVRSRAVATELARLSLPFASTVTGIQLQFREQAFMKDLRESASASARKWLDLILSSNTGTLQPVPDFEDAELHGVDPSLVLHPRRLGDELFLCTADGRIRVSVRPSPRRPYNRIADDLRFTFVSSPSGWGLRVRDPRLAGYQP